MEKMELEFEKNKKPKISIELKKAHLIGDCVSWPQDKSELLDRIIDAPQITRKTFLKHVDKADCKILVTNLGYKGGRENLHIKNDWHVTYHHHQEKGKDYYVLQHSGIEYIFMKKCKKK
jgi:hypothetical protein